MAGNPNKRASRLAELMKGAAIEPLPQDWYALDIKKRLEANLGLSIDRCHQILNLPLEGATPGQLSAIKEVALAHINAGFRFMLNQRRDEERDHVLEKMRLELEATGSRAPAATAEMGQVCGSAGTHDIKRKQHQ